MSQLRLGPFKVGGLCAFAHS